MVSFRSAATDGAMIERTIGFFGPLKRESE
jgi:hypothetical protein